MREEATGATLILQRAKERRSLIPEIVFSLSDIITHRKRKCQFLYGFYVLLFLAKKDIMNYNHIYRIIIGFLNQFKSCVSDARGKGKQSACFFALRNEFYNYAKRRARNKTAKISGG